jgi:hypothetical protein
MTAHQLDLFAPKGTPPAQRIPPYTGWLQCTCGLVFWQWPIERTPLHEGTHSRNGAPNLRPWESWRCWRGFDRMTPTWGRRG